MASYHSMVISKADGTERYVFGLGDARASAKCEAKKTGKAVKITHAHTGRHEWYTPDGQRHDSEPAEVTP